MSRRERKAKPERSAASGLTWDDVRAALGAGYDAGTWFVFKEADLGWSAKAERRCVLTEDWSPSDAAARVLPRSTTTDHGLLSPRHPRGHESTCRLDLPGLIVTTDLLSVDSELIVFANYSCVEPDGGLVANVKRACRSR